MSTQDIRITLTVRIDGGDQIQVFIPSSEPARVVEEAVDPPQSPRITGGGQSRSGVPPLASIAEIKNRYEATRIGMMPQLQRYQQICRIAQELGIPFIDPLPPRASEESIQALGVELCGRIEEALAARTWTKEAPTPAH